MQYVLKEKIEYVDNIEHIPVTWTVSVLCCSELKIRMYDYVKYVFTEWDIDYNKYDEWEETPYTLTIQLWKYDFIKCGMWQDMVVGLPGMINSCITHYMNIPSWEKDWYNKPLDDKTFRNRKYDV